MSLYAYQWFFEDFLGPEMTKGYRKELGKDFIREMEQLDEFIVEGIMTLKKKYPVTGNISESKS